ncbi:MAG: DUF3822 family protein, partial [Bacteroidetes bacterium]|nr:DUF3822 family protein [Bacteroidota bacterium]
MADQYTFEVNLLDESFNPHDTRNCGLAMLVSETAMSFCLLDFKRNKILGLFYCVRNEFKLSDGISGSKPTFRDFLNEVCTDLTWLRNPFKTVKIAYEGMKSTLIPAVLFDSDEKEQFLTFNFTRNQDELIFYDHLMSLAAWQVYTVPESIIHATREFFPDTKVVHSSSLLIESVWINYKNRINSPHLFLHVREHLFDLMIFNGQQMSYFNTFPFQHPEEVAYYLIFVMEQLNFNPETISLVLLGKVDTGDELFELLHRYVRHIDTGRRNDGYKYSYILNQLPSQSFF